MHKYELTVTKEIHNIGSLIAHINFYFIIYLLFVGACAAPAAPNAASVEFMLQDGKNYMEEGEWIKVMLAFISEKVNPFVMRIRKPSKKVHTGFITRRCNR